MAKSNLGRNPSPQFSCWLVFWLFLGGWLGLTGFLAGSAFAKASELMAVPVLSGPVVDQARLLSAASRQTLSRKLQAYERLTGHQLAILIVDTLQGEAPEDFSLRVLKEWKLGSKQHDDGLLLLVVVKDRVVRIEVGYGLEGVIPDALAARVIREVLMPAFGRQDFAGGLEQGLEILMRAGKGEKVTLPQGRSKIWGLGGTAMDFVALFFLLVFFVPLVLLRLFTGLGGGKRNGPRGGGMWWGGGGGFGGGGFGGGGGGFSGGGGSFGGGGASGKW